MTATTADVAVVGGGVIGLSIAWRLAQRGLAVTVVDPMPAQAASRAAAGMLAPVSEVTYGETAQLQLATESLRRYPSFVHDLENVTGHTVGLRREGTMIAATDAGDRERLLELHAFQSALGLSASMLTSRECRAAEPMVSPEVRCALLVRSDHSIDNRRLCAALLAAVEAAGGSVVSARASSVITSGGVARGVELINGDRVDAGTVVVAAGPWSGQLPGVADSPAARVRPVKGEILRLRATAAVRLPTHTLRGLVNGHEIYLVPRADGELVIGATVQDAGFDTTVRAGAVRELLRDARAIMPAVDELELVEAIAALRPGSPDNVPIIGPAAVGGLVLATGHYRNGILLAPVSADLVTSLITGTSSPTEDELLALVSPARFDPVAVRS
jgi:glycine oxidase